MFEVRATRSRSAVVVGILLMAAAAAAQPPTDPISPPVQEPAVQEPAVQEPPVHDHSQMMHMNQTFMQDWLAVAMFNHQGGLRGSDEGRVPNWWMGMWRPLASQPSFMITTMLSLDRVTVGRTGYAELFQAGETLDGEPIVDRQHPHDFFMQLAASWRVPIGQSLGFIVSGGPAAEPAIGPIAFMHRASSDGNPIAPLGHHTLDSTHISYGVVTAALESSRWTIEGSLFNGREPDENRWDFDFGPLDSVAGRIWFRPTTGWDIQVSAANLHEPEPLHPGDVVRATGSVSWTRLSDLGQLALTAGTGTNFEHSEAQTNIFGEGSWSRGRNTLYGRFEIHDADTDTLLGGGTSALRAAAAAPEDDTSHDESGSPFSTVFALTLGGVRRVFTAKGIDIGVGGDLTVYGVPAALESSYGSPVSAHVFLRIRPLQGRMVNMRLGQQHSEH
jgi:hypothetical protein